LASKSIFREYDIRGIYEKELNKRSVKLIGYFLGERVKGKKRVAIGYDARTHSPILRDYLISGLNFSGCEVLDMGLVATPVNYFANYQDEFDTDASIMITGSHNPSEYNGFKITIDKKPFFGDDIYRLRDDILKNMDKEIPDNLKKIDIDVKTPYIEYMVREFDNLKGLDKKIVLDCGNGVVGVVIRDIFDKLELNYQGLFCEPDGTFPNHHPDPTIEENLKDIKESLKDDAKIAFAYDGDGDRVALLTRKYNVKGDQMALLYTLNMKNPTVIGEVKCSMVMYEELEKRGAKAIMYKTGHSNIKVKMREVDADLACEVSGHIFFNDRYFGYDDAIYATLRVLELIKNGMDIDKEIEILPVTYSTVEIKVKTTEAEKFKIIDKIKELLKDPPKDFPDIKRVIDIDGVRIEFEDGWGLVRASNTTPVLVTRFESKDKERAKLYEKKINELILTAKESL
jgi:phosphomannomutase/phosphoglucomutase